MLKQGHTRFLPQALTKQEWRIYGCRQHGRGYRLRDVVMIRKLFGVTLEMYLETRVARFHHDVVVRTLQLIQAFDVNREWATTKPDHSLIQFVITSDRRQVV